MITSILAWFVWGMFYIITPIVFIASLVLLWIEDR